MLPCQDRLRAILAEAGPADIATEAAIDAFVADGIKCPRKMLINSDTRLLAQPRPGALHNINTPDDLDGTGIALAS